MHSPPLVVGEGGLKKALFYRPNDLTDVFFVVANDYETYRAILEHPKVKYRPLREPIPDRAMVGTILREAIPLVQTGSRVTMACAAGVNRSATMSAVVHMAVTGKSFPQAMRDVRCVRPIASPFYWMARTALDVAHELAFIQRAATEREIEAITGPKTAFENLPIHT